MRRTAVYRDPMFLAHRTGRDHLESPERLQPVFAELNRPEVAGQLVLPRFEAAPIEAVAANHSSDHIQTVAATAAHTAFYLDADTRTSNDSYAAALLAAGAVIDGIGRLHRGEIDNGFCLVRPPGHHAERDQAMGFCLFNNVAIGARWALRHLGYERVLIVDWDVHHGNGIQHSFAREAEVLYCSVHQYPLYPGSGALMETGEGNGQGFTVNVPLLSGHGDAEYARVMETLFVPIGRLFRPDLVLVSCGFDCMAGDPVGSMRLTPAGIACLTRRLVQLAGEVCNGRLLLVLEGGYDLDNMRTGTLAALTELRGGPLAADHPVFLPPGAEGRLLRDAAPSDGIDQAITWARNWWALP